MKKYTLLWALISVLLFPLLSLGAGSGGSDDDGDDEDDAPDVNTLTQTLIAKHGDAQRAVGVLATENHKLRADRRKLRKLVPPEGAVVLSKEEGASWAAYQELGKPEDVKAGLAKRDELEQTVSEQQRQSRIRQAAQAAGYKDSVLARLLKDEVVEVEGEGENQRAVVVKDNARTPLADYAKSHWSDFLPALQQSDGQQGTPFPHQSGNKEQGGTAPKGIVEEMLQRNKAAAEAKNPLRRT